MPKGANSCRNFGFQVSKGEYVNWLDDDDLFSKNKIEEQLNLLKKSGSLIATCKWGRFENICKFKTKELPIYRDYEDGYELIRDYGETKTFFPSHAFMLNRNILTKAGLWNEDLTINQDGEFFTRVLLNCSGVKHSNEGAVYYRQSLKEDSVSSFSSNEKARDAILSWILIDTYIKIYTKSSKSCKYVINAKQYLKQEIKEIEILKEYSFFLGKKTLLSLGKQLIKKWF